MGGNKIMNRRVLVMLLITTVFLIGVPQVEANRNIFNNFTKLYNVPNVSDAKLNTCKTCMASTAPPNWNKYGLDMRSNAAFDRNNPIQAMKNIEPLDSDGDKFINIDEIHNSTLPGNESDYPMILITPVKTSSTVTITPTGTEPKPAYTIMNGFVTIIMFAIVYFFAIRKRDQE
jgi:hypothetical protein